MNATLRPHGYTAVIVLMAYCAGYLAGRTLLPSEESGSQRAKKNMVLERAPKAGGDARVASSGDEDLRKGRVLAALLEATQESDREALSQHLQLAAAEIGPGEIVAALELAYRFSYYPRHEAIGILVARWAEFDPKGAAEYALQSRPVHANAKSALLMQAVAAWGEQNMAEAKAWALALKNPEQRRQAIAGLIDGVAQTDGPRAMAMIAELPDELRGSNLYQPMVTWATRDPAAAAHYLASHPTKVGVGDPIYLVAMAWAGQDPAAAHAWAMNLPSASARLTAKMTIYPALLATEPETIAAEIVRFPPGRERDQLLECIRRGYGEDFKGVVPFALALPPSPERTETLRAGMAGWGGTEPEKAIATLQALPAEIADDESKGNMLWSIARTWSAKNHAAAMEWVGSLEVGSAKDWSLAGIANALYSRDPKEGIELSLNIGDVEHREKTVRQLFQWWNSWKPEAARAWLETANVPADWKTAWKAAPKAVTGK